MTSWEVDTLPEALAMSGLGLVALWVSINVLNGVAWLCGQWTRLLLGPETPTRLRQLV
jgi:ABC-type transport system involved in cytochrome bd biosynthesis fused ATPase/permease subunit